MTPQEQNLIERLPQYRGRAIGQRLTVQESKHMATNGIITDVQFGRFKYTGRSVMLVFKVSMECGTNRVPREFFLTRIPG